MDGFVAFFEINLFRMRFWGYLQIEISPETLIYGIFPGTILRDSVYANGGADAQWTISIPKTYSKHIPYSNPNPYPKTNPSLIPKFDKKKMLKTQPFDSLRKTHLG